MAKTYNEWKEDQLKSRVYNALVEIVNDLDATEEELTHAFEWFILHYEEFED